jgi:PAS domain-containing protein
MEPSELNAPHAAHGHVLDPREASEPPRLHLVKDGHKRSRADETANESERRFHDLLNALPAAVYTTDAAGRITYFNEAAAELWGHRPVLGTSEWCGSPGGSSGPTARRCRMTNARWRSR